MTEDATQLDNAIRTLSNEQGKLIKALTWSAERNHISTASIFFAMAGSFAVNCLLTYLLLKS